MGIEYTLYARDEKAYMRLGKRRGDEFQRDSSEIVAFLAKYSPNVVCLWDCELEPDVSRWTEVNQLPNDTDGEPGWDAYQEARAKRGVKA